MSNDTDFLIFDSKTVLSARDIDLNDMSTLRFDKELLMKDFGIHQASHLHMYACMMGNDVISKDSLRAFHGKIGGQRWKDMKVRSDAICKLLPKLVGESFEETSCYVFGNNQHAKRLKTAADCYVLTNASTLLNFHMGSLDSVTLSRPSYIEVGLWNHIVSSCMRAECIIDVLEVLKLKEFRTPESIEHYGVHAFSGSVFKQVRQRTYYLLFKHLVNPGKDGIPNVAIQECIPSPGQRMGNAVPVGPLKLNVTVPTLDHVFFGSNDEIKSKLFLCCFNIQEEWARSLQLVPPRMRFFACIVKFLFAHSELRLQTYEKEALIAQASKQFSAEFQAQIKPLYDIEPISFGGFFAKAIAYSLYVYSACGRPFWKTEFPRISFNGKYYNYFYAQLKGGSEVKQLLSQEERVLFNTMMDIVS